MVDRLHLLITGRVQGVGFRFSALEQAVRLDLKGWVRNLPDGRVEAELEGTRDHLDRMLDWAREGPRLALVTDVKVCWESGEPRYDEIRVLPY